MEEHACKPATLALWSQGAVKLKVGCHLGLHQPCLKEPNDTIKEKKKLTTNNSLSIKQQRNKIVCAVCYFFAVCWTLTFSACFYIEFSFTYSNKMFSNRFTLSSWQSSNTFVYLIDLEMGRTICGKYDEDIDNCPLQEGQGEKKVWD